MITFESAILKLTFQPGIQSYALLWITLSPNKAHCHAFFSPANSGEEPSESAQRLSATRDTSQLLLQLCSLISDRVKGLAPSY